MGLRTRQGSFLLAAHFVDVLARLGTTRTNGKAAWDEFVPRFMPSYADHSGGLYRGYRGALSHSYSVDGFRFVDTEASRHRHLGVEGGDRVLHLETFLDDLETAWSEFVRRVEEDGEFRDRVLERTRETPLLTVLDDEAGHASVAQSVTRVVAGPTSIGAVQATSGCATTTRASDAWASRYTRRALADRPGPRSRGPPRPA